MVDTDGMEFDLLHDGAGRVPSPWRGLSGQKVAMRWRQ